MGPMNLTKKRAQACLALVVGAALWGCSGGEADDGANDGADSSPEGTGGRSESAGDGDGDGDATDPGSGGSGTASGGTTSSPDLNGTLPDPTAIDCRVEGDDKTTLVFINGCSQPVTFRGSDIAGGDIAPGAFVCVDVGDATAAINSKRYWGYIDEDPGGERHTLAEFTFNTDFYDFDWYNISHVDAHNLPMQIVPVNRPDCHVETCAESWLDTCPPEGQYKNDQGQIISCVSPDRDNSMSPVALFFEACDDAYAWSGDDQHGTDPSPMRACAGEDWDIVFCPEAQ